MSFRVGQILSSNLESSSLLEEMHWADEPLETKNEITGNIFIDRRITDIYSSNGNNTEDNAQGFISGNYYYIKLIIKRKFPNHNQNITLRLSNDQGVNQSKNYQYVDDFIIFAGGSTTLEDPQYAVYETILAPNASYSQLNIILGREMVDYITTKNPENPNQENWNSSNYKGREIKISACQIYKLNNILGNNSIPSPLTKIGVQGPPGMLMCINGEPIRIGPSGIYEIRNGYKIIFLSFIRKVYDVTVEGETLVVNPDVFIVDYQYNDSTTNTNTSVTDNQNNNEEGA